jgi:hypothetical protein
LIINLNRTLTDKEMKIIVKNILLLMLPLLMIGGLMSSCNEEELVNGGKPVIHYVRITNPAAADSLLVGAPLSNLIAIVGDNLGDTRELWFNDRQAALNPAFITNTSILVTVPNRAPIEVNNKMRLVFGDGSELLHDFETTISAPEVVSMVNEYAPIGSTTKITGDFFFEPISVTFAGGVEAEIVSVSQEEIEFIVPEGAESGPITLTTNFGSSEAPFHYRDRRGIVLDYDELTAEDSWRPGETGDDNGIDGKYLMLGGPGQVLKKDRVEDPFTSQFWGHTRFPEKTNLVEGNIDDFVLKFETRVVDWYGSVLTINWGPWDNAGNQEVWAHLNGKGIWRPWLEEDQNFSTDGEWITVAIPINEMIYSYAQEEGFGVWNPDSEFDKNNSGTLSFWVMPGKQVNEDSGSPVEIHIDNVRIVEK